MNTSNAVLQLQLQSLKAILEAYKDSLSLIAPSISPTTLTTRATIITKVAATTKVATTNVRTTKVKITISSIF